MSFGTGMASYGETVSFLEANPEQLEPNLRDAIAAAERNGFTASDLTYSFECDRHGGCVVSVYGRCDPKPRQA